MERKIMKRRIHEKFQLLNVEFVRFCKKKVTAFGRSKKKAFEKAEFRAFTRRFSFEPFF
jgi:hypothetical protein